MVKALRVSEILGERYGQPWLQCPGAIDFWPTLQFFQSQLDATQPRHILLVESEPVKFLAAFLAACQQPGHLWLANPQWGQREWQQVAAQCHPDLIIGTVSPAAEAYWRDRPRPVTPPPATNSTSLQNGQSSPAEATILIPTGGSSGNLRFATHTWTTLSASVLGFQQHFQQSTISAYCVLPLFHVSGLMQALRCLLSGGRLTVQPFRELLQTGAIASCAQGSFLSLVPTQLQRLLKGDRNFIPWLQSFTAILLGGAPAWPSLLRSAREHRLPLAPTYGMTETASQVATLLPQEFLHGNPSSGRPLPHAGITICDDGGHPLPAQQTGHIHITAASLARGYGKHPLQPPFQTGDLGYLDEAGYLYVLGRQTTLIITGGEKVLPAEVEAAILSLNQVDDVAVVGVPDADWGEAVVAVVVPSGENWSSDRLHQHLQPLLSSYKLPKHWLSQASLPRNAQGKVDYAELRQWIQPQLASDSATVEARR